MPATLEQVINILPRLPSAVMLYRIIAEYDGKKGFPCGLSATEMGFLLGVRMKRTSYSVKLIEKNLKTLRNVGLIQTCILQWKSRDLLIPTGQFAKEQKTIHFARGGEVANLPVIRVNLSIYYEKRDIPKGSKWTLIPTENGEYVFILHINNNKKRINSFLGELKEDEVKRISNMIGFHEIFSKKESNPIYDEMARRFYIVVRKKVVGKRTSLAKWSTELERIANRHKEQFPLVFEWLMENIPKQDWLCQAVQSPSSIGKKWDRIVGWMERDKPKKSKYELPEDYEDYREAIEGDIDHFRKKYEDVIDMVVSIHPNQMQRAIYDSYQLINRVIESLTNIPYPNRTKMSECVGSVHPYLVSEKTYRVQMGINLERLREWSETGWKGHLCGRNNIALVQIDDCVQVSNPAKTYLTNLLKKTTASPAIRDRVFNDIIGEIET
jgi:hypothetical protein